MHGDVQRSSWVKHVWAYRCALVNTMVDGDLVELQVSIDKNKRVNYSKRERD